MIKSFDETVNYLREIGLVLENENPSIPSAMPSWDDKNIVGISIFRMKVGATNFSNLTLPRTYFGKSELNGTDFSGTDFFCSRLCWNDFVKVNFLNSNLSDSDLRCSVFEDVSFVGANLDNTDLRLSEFTNCDFSGASMRGSLITHGAAATLHLTEPQRSSLKLVSQEGKEPGGG